MEFIENDKEIDYVNHHKGFFVSESQIRATDLSMTYCINNVYEKFILIE